MKKFLVLAVIGIFTTFFIYCSNQTDAPSTENLNKFNYAFFNSNKETSLNLNNEISIIEKKSLPNTQILNVINSKFGSVPT